MLPRADLTAPRPPGSVEASTRSVSATDARLEVFQRLRQIAIGREVQATVASKLDDGMYLVKLADSAARMALPVGTKVGDQLSMTFIAREPRPTFLLAQQQGSAPASLSATARLINHLLQSAEQNGAPTSAIARTPLLAADSLSDPQRVAAALQNELTSSGLFYESHLQDWISGSRPLSDLAREPQAQLAQAEKAKEGLSSPETMSTYLARLPPSLKELGDGTQKLLDLIREGRLQSSVHQGIDADLIAPRQNPLPAVDSEAARLIHLQLNTLEHQRVRWQGELWPGQQMEWEISDGKPEGEPQEQEQPVWSSVVRFELPHLGNVSASFRLVGDRVHVQVNTPNGDTAAALQEYRLMLADALQAAGSPLDFFLVKRDESS